MAYVDLHSHVLPAIDDGAANLDESFAMLELAERDGTVIIAATPHAHTATRERVEAEVAALNRAAQARGLRITIVPGSEVRFDADLATRFRSSEMVTLNQTSWVLLELSLRGEWSPYLQQGIYDLQMAGGWPILAHAERYPAVQRDPDILLDFIAQGGLVQVNADSIVARGERTAGRVAEQLLQRRMVHVVASDAHDAKVRPPQLHAAMLRVRQLTDDAYADWLSDVPQQIIQGQQVYPSDPISAPRQGKLRRLFSRS